MSGTSVTSWGTVSSTTNPNLLSTAAMQASFDLWFATLLTSPPLTFNTYWNNGGILAKTAAS